MFSVPLCTERSVIVNASAEKVFSYLVDFEKFGRWSPWLILEQVANTSLVGTPGTIGHGQTWKGTVTGEGSQVISGIVKNKRVDFDLEFLKPWKSKSKAWFELEEQQGGVKVTWSLRSSLPFFLFFLKKMMIGLLSSDYDRGLSMLKTLVETGVVPSKLVRKGVNAHPAFQLIGIRRTCKFGDLGTCMEKDFAEVSQYFAQKKWAINLGARSLYEKFCFSNQEATYVSGFLGEFDGSVPLPSSMVHLSFPAHDSLDIEHRGPYQFLGNAWSLAMGLQRYEKRKQVKNVPTYESYITMPGEVQETEISTIVSVPVRA
jgi:uncharacterized protein YndB with AHSA1/START domain